MGRNAAFGRPPASERVRTWWDARSKTSQQNALLALGIGAVFVAIILAATARDKSPSSRVISSRPQPSTMLGLPTPSTVNIGDLSMAGTAPPADLLGPSTTTTTPAPATANTAPAPTPTRPPATVATTVAPAPATTVANPEVIFSTVPTTQPPVTTTKPAPTTTAPPTTTTTTLLSLPLNVSGLLPPS